MFYVPHKISKEESRFDNFEIIFPKFIPDNSQQGFLKPLRIVCCREPAACVLVEKKRNKKKKTLGKQPKKEGV